MFTTSRSVWLSVAFLALLGVVPAAAQEIADRIWHGGTILTMNDAAMRAEAVAGKDGRIIAVGTADVVMAHRGEGTEVIDLGGRAMVPGFVDSHGHVVMGGLQGLSANLLAPPDGDVTDIASLQQVLRQWMAANREAVEKFNLIVGFGYDSTTLAEHRHPTRDDLDAVATDIPIYVVHQSGYFGAANVGDQLRIYPGCHLPLGLGLLHQPGLQRRHRPDPVLRRLLDGPHGPPVARRPLRLPAPLERGACAHGKCATRHAPSTDTGVVTFLMG